MVRSVLFIGPMTKVYSRMASLMTPWRAIILLIFWLVLAAVFRDIDYDEGQYVGAAALMRSGLPFRDFFYLQTPLQPLLLAPLAWVVDQHLFLALRLANAAMVGTTAVIVYRTVTAHGGKQTAALSAAALMLLCEPMIFIGAVARNDAMPLLFEIAGIALLMSGWRSLRHWSIFMLAGLCFGAAISTKLNFALSGVVAGLFLIAYWQKLGLWRILAFATGGMIGLLPSIFIWRLAPDAFMFGVLEYGLTAPWQWYHLGNRTEMFTLPVMIGRLLMYAGLGPTIVALVATARQRITNPREGGTALLLDALIAAGLIAALMPQPLYRQYLAPLYPPLFIRLGLLVSWWPLKRNMRVLYTMMTVGGLVEASIPNGDAILPNLVFGHSPPLVAMEDAHWLGQTPGGRQRLVAGLSPELVIDSGLVFDPRFATGPFIFRTRGLITEAEARRWHVMPSERMDVFFAENPPDLIVTGGHRKLDVAAPLGLDAEFDRWALANHWPQIRSPSGKLVVYVRPRGN